MAKIPAKVLDRFSKEVTKFQKVIKSARNNDINESDTVTIVTDMLCDIFGYDKYTEITSEYAIRNTYCDLAIKVSDSVKYLIEVKSISLDLKENHLKQAVDYGAHEGIQWVILTNGLIWQIYSVTLKQSIDYEKICEIHFLEINGRKKSDQEILFILAKEGLSKDVLSEYHERVKSVNKNVISAILLNPSMVETIKRELRKVTPGLKVDSEEIEAILKNDVIKRNVLEADNFIEAEKHVKRALAKAAKKRAA